MGGLQFKKLSNEYNSITQKPFVDKRSARCSSFTSLHKTNADSTVAPPAAAAAIRVMDSTPPESPLSNRANYDPVYDSWKNAFEEKARTPRKVSPIREMGSRSPSQHIPDALAGQLTPNGFPSYTELKPSKTAANCGNNKEEVSSKRVRRRSALRMAARRRKFFEGTEPLIQEGDYIKTYGIVLDGETSSDSQGC